MTYSKVYGGPVGPGMRESFIPPAQDRASRLRAAVLTCDRCQHWFDPTDQRAQKPVEEALPILCPACAIEDGDPYQRGFDDGYSAGWLDGTDD